MPPSEPQAQMSSIVPRFLRLRLGAWFERRLSLRSWDRVNQFWVQSRLVFSKAIVLMVVAMLGFFSFVCIAQGLYEVRRIFPIVIFVFVLLAVLLNMGLWETERDGRTFELLLMRVPTVDGLIWFKLRVTLIWMLVLALPIPLGLLWFTGMNSWHLALIVLFNAFIGVMVALLVNVVSTFIRHSIAAGVVSLFISIFLISFFAGAPLPYRNFYNPVIDPVYQMPDGFTLPRWIWTMTVNRGAMLLVAGGFYWWLRRRLGKTELWIE